jgi:small subunit ribosomal protein S16
MLKIRLSRIGKKKQPHYRLVISEQARDTYGHALEILGYYNPRTKIANIKNERIKYWLEKGAQTSPTIHNLFINNKIIEDKKVTVTHISDKRKAKQNKDVKEEKSTKPEVKKTEELKAENDEKKEETQKKEPKTENIDKKEENEEKTEKSEEKEEKSE